ncbi:MAG: gamma-glutamyltransferase [Kiloniellales bacterium]|nr:gamma-glutamyltransferase [Kiloniellales bacterium]
MAQQAIEQWQIDKPVARSTGGVVAAQNARAARVGADVLGAGGTAVDAAVATAFALGVVEPWMSGLGGCGYLMSYRRETGEVAAVDFATAAPRTLDAGAFALDPGGTADADLFGWPRVVEDRNVQGPLSIGLPGTVAGLALAHERFGRLPWRELLQPAIALAREGHPVDWWSTLRIAGEAAALRCYPDAAGIYLPGGLPPVAAADGSVRLDLGALAATLERLATVGPEDFYRGEIAQALAGDVAAAGGWLSAADLAAYRATVAPPQRLQRGGAEIHLLQGLNAGPTFADALARLPALPPGPPGPEAFTAIARALWAAYEDRLARLGHDGDTANQGGGQASTTHVSVADREGNLATLTNTLLSLFGSKVLSPSTGVLLNNGIMWFDPTPGRPNSIAAGKRPLSNMCPRVATRGGAPWFALGGSGGRRILPAVFQLTAFLVDCGLTPDEAVAHPRLNVDGGPVVEADPRLGPAVLEALAAALPVQQVEALVSPNHYANPLIAGREGETAFGAAQIRSPVSAAIAV